MYVLRQEDKNGDAAVVDTAIKIGEGIMMQAFTRNYKDNSTQSGFQFTFFCDSCKDGYKTGFMDSKTYKMQRGLRVAGTGASIAGSLIGGKANRVAQAANRGSMAVAGNLHGRMSPEWKKEHEKAFELGQNEAKQHFTRCPSCNKYVCGQCWNEDSGLCTRCAPRQEVYVAKAHAGAMKRNINQAERNAQVWNGAVESKTTVCPSCGKPAGSGKFCNSCGASLDMKECPGCGMKNSQSVRFCNHCGENLQNAVGGVSNKCNGCGMENAPGTRFCGGCGNKLI